MTTFAKEKTEPERRRHPALPTARDPVLVASGSFKPRPLLAPVSMLLPSPIPTPPLHC